VMTWYGLVWWKATIVASRSLACCFARPSFDKACSNLLAIMACRPYGSGGPLEGDRKRRKPVNAQSAQRSHVVSC
jgi:hypothetical protein